MAGFAGSTDPYRLIKLCEYFGVRGRPTCGMVDTGGKAHVSTEDVRRILAEGVDVNANIPAAPH